MKITNVVKTEKIELEINTDMLIKEILAIPEVARLLKKDPRTIRSWVANGELKGFIPPGGRDYIVFRSDMMVVADKRNIAIEGE